MFPAICSVVVSVCAGSGGVTMTCNTYDRLIPLAPPQFSADTSPWFAGKMERGQAEQFLMDVSGLGLRWAWEG